jgi:hypothetical protein
MSDIQSSDSSKLCSLEGDGRPDLPLSLLDQLLVSEIVPLEAKIKSIESWQEELAEVRSPSAAQVELEKHLAAAKRLLLNELNRPSRLSSLVGRIRHWGERLALMSRRAHSKAVAPARILGTVATARSPVTGL